MLRRYHVTPFETRFERRSDVTNRPSRLQPRREFFYAP
jgi:hypothetical protein